MEELWPLAVADFGEGQPGSARNATESSSYSTKQGDAKHVSPNTKGIKAVSISEAVVRAALEDIFDIMEEGHYLLRAGRLMENIKQILTYFSEQLEGTFAAAGPGVSADQCLATLESLNDKMKYALGTKDVQGGFSYAQAEANAVDPATIMVIINVAIQLIKLWKQLRG